MASELETESEEAAIVKETAADTDKEPGVSNKKSLTNSTCQCYCCHFPRFVGSAFKSSSVDSLEPLGESDYKPYFELETEEERLSYEYLKLLARVTYDEVVERHREQALEELHQYRLSLLLEELRLIEETDILCSSSDDDCFSDVRIRFPEKRRSLRIKNKKRRFQKQRIRK